MAYIVRDLLGRVEEDPFRQSAPFDPPLRDALTSLLATTGDDTNRRQIISDWLGKHQPCLFGRIAARLGGLHYCFLSEADLNESDETISDKIQLERRRWRKKAFSGDASGFVILALSARLARAIPNENVQKLAQRICHLYLGESEVNQIILEDVFLRVPGKEDAEIHWKAGVNYFSAQGDQRWWHDHRIPAGIAFSINSVGHMVRSFEIGRSAEEMWEKLGLSKEEWANLKVGSLGQALIYAMQTINGSAVAVSGKATELLPADRTDLNGPKCPITLPANLKGKDYCEYFGHYHTDVTLPAEYFRADIERPDQITGHKLDFTYLFDSSIENSAFRTMGKGIRVRAKNLSRRGRKKRDVRRMFGQYGLIRDHPQLREALERE